MLHFLVDAAVALVLVVMAVQDFRYRGISWYHFPLLAVLLCCSKAAFDTDDLLLNFSFISLIFGLLTLWFSLREGRLINLLDNHIGTGDFLFLACIALYLPFSSFFLFYLLSTILILIGTGLYLSLRKPGSFTVPLAGLQSLLLLIALACYWYRGMELYEFKLLYEHWL